MGIELANSRLTVKRLRHYVTTSICIMFFHIIITEFFLFISMVFMLQILCFETFFYRIRIPVNRIIMVTIKHEFCVQFSYTLVKPLAISVFAFQFFFFFYQKAWR